MIQQAPVTESQIIPRYELRITGIPSTTVQPFSGGTDFILKTRVSRWNPSAPHSLPECVRLCSLLPHFGTLSKIQKGGEPVPQPVEER